MAKFVYIGATNARRVSSLYIGVNGSARRITKAYIGVSGSAKQFYPPSPRYSEGRGGSSLVDTQMRSYLSYWPIALYTAYSFDPNTGVYTLLNQASVRIPGGTSSYSMRGYYGYFSGAAFALDSCDRDQDGGSYSFWLYGSQMTAIANW